MYTAFAITGDGKVWACGEDYYGELGSGLADYEQDYFKEVLTSHTVAKIKGGKMNTLFTDSSGALWGVGKSGGHQLGLDEASPPTGYATPQKIVDPTGTVKAWDGYSVTEFVSSIDQYHGLFIANNSLWGMGSNSNGVLGISQNDNSNYIYDAFKDVGNNTSTTAAHPIRVEEANDGTSLVGNVSLVSSDNGTTILVSLDGKSAWGCGQNNYGQCGTGDDGFGYPLGSEGEEDEPHCYRPVEVVLPDMAGRAIIQVSTGYEHSLILMSDGSLWGMGRNSSGQLGEPNPVNGVDGWVVDGSSNEVYSPVEIIGSGVAFIAASDGSSFAVKSDGTLLGWGYNATADGGQLGNARYITDVTVSDDNPNYPITLSTYPIPHDLLDGYQPSIRYCMTQANQRSGASANTAPDNILRTISVIDQYSFSLNGAELPSGNDAQCQALGEGNSPCTEPLSAFPADQLTISEPYARVWMDSSNTAFSCRHPQVIPIHGIAWNTKSPYGQWAPAVDEGSTAGFMPPVGTSNRVPIESSSPIAISHYHSIFITTLEGDASNRPDSGLDHVWTMGNERVGQLGQISPDSNAVAGVYNASNVGNPYNFPYHGQSHDDAGGIRDEFPNQVWISSDGT